MARPPKPIVFNSAEHAPPVAHIKQENQSTSPPQQQQPHQLIPHVKGEPQDLPVVALQVPDKAQILQSIEQLKNLSTSINEFYRRYDELQNHLDFIQSAIYAHSKEQRQQEQPIQSGVPATASAPAPVPPTTPIITAKEKTIEAVETANRKTETDKAVVSTKSELISLCEVMCGRGLRKYLTSHLSNVKKLRAEVPSALKCASKPARLVLDCMGRFYLQGSRAYTKNSPMIPGRKAGILILEFFLLIIDNDIEFDASVKQEAEQAAVAWRKRLVAEGGVSRASEIDARGLLLFVGCFGIPKVFSNEDVWDLIRLSSPKQIADALRRSRFLVARISDILERMMNHGAKIEAVDVAYTFGVEKKFPPQKLLTSFLRDSNEALKRRKREANISPIVLKEASEKQVAALKTVIKLLEDRKFDPTKLLPGWQLREMIDKLEKEIGDINKKIADKVTPKRKADENEFASNLRSQETKRSRFTGSPLISSPSIGLHEQRAAGHVDGNSLFSASLRMNLLDGGFSGQTNNPASAGPMPYGYSVPSLPEHAIGMVKGGGSILQGAGVGLSTGYSAPTSSFSGVHKEMLDRNGQIMGRNGPPYGWHGVGGSSYVDGPHGQSFVHQPASGLFSPSIEGFAGLPNSPPTGGANRNSTSDLYRFADAVK
ncbi:hypothetical protein JCGZ_26334 [Jatropha curcas]|uniref:FRIGIDA-like protein n=1 Tax=Jatropha curcas TaxID=180498 RepID=A0A067JI55_JATCU|nr:hypothetical protein JCGZ_26334 [Jatropha curcas]